MHVDNPEDVKMQKQERPSSSEQYNTITELSAAFFDTENDLFHSLVEQYQHPIVVSRLDGSYVYVNSAFASIRGFDNPEDMVGKSLVGLGYQVGISEDRIVSLLMENGRIDNIETTLQYPNGSVKDIVFSGRLIKLQGQELVLSTSIDISHQKKKEKELLRHKAQLEELVKGRTEELECANEELLTVNEEFQSTNDQLLMQRKLVEEAYNQLKETQQQLVQSEKMASLGILTAGIAHEINNPLNFVQNGLVAIEQYLNEQAAEHMPNLSALIEAVNIGIDRMTEIVKSLRKYSRGHNLPATDCNIEEIIEAALTILAHKLKGRILVEKHFAEMPKIKGNEGALHQVFLNLIDNAIEAIESEGHIAITLALREQFAIVTISDDGEGMAPEQMKHIFDPFFTTKPSGTGTGLGLSITQQIVTEHGGTIEVDSLLKQGTTMIVKLPIIG